VVKRFTVYFAEIIISLCLHFVNSDTANYIYYGKTLLANKSDNNRLISYLVKPLGNIKKAFYE
jgi:hypothetical protein